MDKNTALLCVGGPLDGTYYSFNGDFFLAPNRDHYEPKDYANGSGSAEDVRLDVTEYRRRKFGYENWSVEIFAVNDFTEAQIFSRLFDNYNPTT